MVLIGVLCCAVLLNLAQPVLALVTAKDNLCFDLVPEGA
jgi:hypothetical protein